MSGTEWSLHPSVFRALTRELGIPLLDLFATRWNHKLPLFVSPVPDPTAMAVDALSKSRKALWAYAYPPTALLSRVLEKAQRDQCELILIAPHWPQAIWFPLLLGMLIQSPLRIPNIPRLLSQPRSVQSPATRVESNWDALCSRGLSIDVASCVSRPQRECTLAIYESKWRIFTAWCNIQHINPLSATESVVSDFLLHFHTEKHLTISTIAGYQMAIASTLRATSGAEVGRNPALKSLLRNIEMEQGQHQRHFPEWNLALVLSALTKPSFEPLDQSSDQLLTWKTVFLIALASGKRRGEIHAFEHARLQRTTGWTQVTLRVGLSFISKTQVLGKGPKCVLSCTILALDRHLSNGMAEDRLLCPIRALKGN